MNHRNLIATGLTLAVAALLLVARRVSPKPSTEVADAVVRIPDRPPVEPPSSLSSQIPIGSSGTVRDLLAIVGFNGRNWTFLGYYPSADQATDAVAYFGQQFEWYGIQVGSSDVASTAAPPRGNGNFALWEHDSSGWWRLQMSGDEEFSREKIANLLTRRMRAGFKQFLLRRVG